MACTMHASKPVPHTALRLPYASLFCRCDAAYVRAGLVRDLLVSVRDYARNKPKRPDAMSDSTLGIMSFMGCGITVLNMFWFYKMCRGAVKVFRPASSRKSSGAALEGGGGGGVNGARKHEPTPALVGSIMPSAHEADIEGAFDPYAPRPERGSADAPGAGMAAINDASVEAMNVSDDDT